ncbi:MULTISPECIES: c-type cytochrome [Sphingomonas]|uniref:c-type cytochrome n=1 Tax=Sphingomonas TaxID=13687 RepID=UPI000DEEB0C5|nr:MULTISPECIES: cytochrome c family protein [Sphingomonas]
MKDTSNTIAGWVLGAGIVALGGSLLAGEYFNNERPEKMGFPIEGVVQEGDAGAAAEQPIEFYLAKADPAKGADVFKKCQACHTIEQGQPNGLGPNLYHVVGEPAGSGRGFAWSPALSGKGGTWNWDTLNQWLTSPKKYAPGTKMTFAGLSNPEERANVIAFLNSKSPSPLPMPAAPAAGADAKAGGATPAAAGAKAAAENASAGAQKAKDQPVLNEQQAATAGQGSIGGEGASKLTGPSPTQKASPANNKK